MLKIEDVFFSPDNKIDQFDIDLENKIFSIKCEEAYVENKILANFEMIISQYEKLSIMEYEGILYSPVDFKSHLHKLKDICEFVCTPELITIRGFSNRTWTEYQIYGGIITLNYCEITK